MLLRRLRPFVAALTCAFSFLAPAHGLIAPDGGDDAARESALRKVSFQMTEGVAFPYWSHVGQIDRSTGIYLGNGYVMTAAHVSVGHFRMHDGRVYLAIPESAQYFRNRSGTTADLLLFRIRYRESDPIAKLESIPLTTMPPRKGTRLLLIGGGAGGDARGREYAWSDDYRVRWGFNSIEEIYASPMPTEDFQSYGFATRFERRANDCQAAPGDSGGGAFHFHPVRRRWELAGVIVAVDSQFGAACYGNQTYIADPALFRRELAVAWEPATTLLASRE